MWKAIPAENRILTGLLAKLPTSLGWEHVSNVSTSLTSGVHNKDGFHSVTSSQLKLLAGAGSSWDLVPLRHVTCSPEVPLKTPLQPALTQHQALEM